MYYYLLITIIIYDSLLGFCSESSLVLVKWIGVKVQSYTLDLVGFVYKIILVSESMYRSESR